MTRIGMIFVVLACSACASFDHPIVAESGPTLDPALVGTWEGVNEGGEPFEMRVRPEGEIGIAEFQYVDKDGETEAFAVNLVTARLEQWSFASVQPIEDNEHKVWIFYAYSSVGPDRLLVRNANIDFWKRAVQDKIVSGEIRRNVGHDSVTVTTSGEELRKVVLGYGAVLFDDEVAFELRRLPEAGSIQ